MGLHADCDKFRQSIADVLYAAGAKGITSGDLADAIGRPRNSIRWHLARVPEAVSSTTKSQCLCRWWHKDFSEHAAAYSVARNAAPRGRFGLKEDRVQQLVEHVERSGACGIALDVLAHKVGLSVATLQSFAGKFATVHGLGFARGGKHGMSVFYPCGVEVPAKAPKPAKAKRKENLEPKTKQVKKPKEWGAAKLAPAKPKKATTVAPQGPAIIPAGVRITVCPSGTDNRFRVERPNPVFSGLRPGQYPVSTGSVIESVYAAR